MNFLTKIKNLFKKKNPNIRINKDSKEIMDELKEAFYEKTANWEDVPLMNCLKDKTEKKKLLIIDDYAAVTNLIKKDLNIISEKNFRKQLNIKTIKMIDTLNIKLEDIETCIVTGELAPYIVYKTCEEYECAFDYAIIDILFGDFVIKDGIKIYFDGISVAKLLKKINPNIKIVLFTGCYLDNYYNKEEKRIRDELGEDYITSKILIKTEDLDTRLQFFIEKLFKD